MDFEAKLAEYRAKKHQEYLDTSADRADKASRSSGFFGFANMDSVSDGEPLIEQSEVELDSENLSLFSDRRKVTKYIVLLGTWSLAFFTFIQIQWGAVFFVVSALIFIYANTRTGPKRIGEVSAYSVFNRGCKTIEGTLTAEQFEKELRYGPGTV